MAEDTSLPNVADTNSEAKAEELRKRYRLLTPEKRKQLASMADGEYVEVDGKKWIKQTSTQRGPYEGNDL